jgi:hypothetical protein
LARSANCHIAQNWSALEQGFHMKFSGKTENERFDEKVAIGDVGECWNWTGSLDKDGYGMFRSAIGNRAHRFAYQRAFGEIPKGEGFHGTCICHRCDNPACVNPDHLFAGTMADNMADMKRKGRARHPVGGKGSVKGSSAHPIKLTAEKAAAIANSSLSHRQLGAIYGVDRTMIYQIKNGKAWSAVTGIIPKQKGA